MNAIIAQTIKLLASLLLDSDTFERVIATVERWADKEISGAEKRTGVLNELEIIGLKMSKSLANLLVELAVQYIKRIA